MKRLLLVLLAAALVVPAGASARMVNDQQRIALFTPIAAAIFPSECVPFVKVTITNDLSTVERGAEAGAVVTPDVFAAFGPSICTIKIRPWVGEDLEDVVFCQLLVHEYGHLAGLDHAETGIMRPDSDLEHPLPACVAAVASTRSDRDRVEDLMAGEKVLSLKKIRRGTRPYRRGIRYVAYTPGLRWVFRGHGARISAVAL